MDDFLITDVSKFLFLVRTKFQARLIKSFYEAFECQPEIDIIIISQENNANEIRKILEGIKFRYLKVLEYNYVRFNFFEPFYFFKNIADLILKRYDFIVFGSLDAGPFNAFVKIKKNSSLITVDDGIGNVFTSSELHRNKVTKKQIYYRILGLHLSLDQIKKRLLFHVTAFPNLNNLQPRARYFPVNFSASETGFFSLKKNNINIFIQSLRRDEKEKDFRRTIYDMDIDFSIPHPAAKLEDTSWLPGVVIKSEFLAEELILEASLAKAKKILVITSFSTVILHSFPRNVNKLCVISGRLPFFDEKVDICKRVGGSYVRI